MPVYAIIKLETTDSRILQEKYNLESFSIFKRGTIKRIIRSLVRTISTKAKDTSSLYEVREQLTEAEKINLMMLKRGETRVVVITDSEYDSVVAHKLVLHAFSSSDYDTLIQDYKSCEQKDTMRKIEEELKKCHVVVAQSLSQVLERGESLSDLVEKSENLSSQTKLLFKTAKKRNRCC